MATKRAGVPPEECLQRAMASRSRGERAKWAKLGLASSATIDATTRAMLLRQLYLSLFEARRFREAHAVALRASTLGVLPDVLLQDAARAALAAGELEDALAHLREAARDGPSSRRAFHYWTLGSVLFLAHRYEEAVAALSRAAKTTSKERSLYRAHLALAKIASGQSVGQLQPTIDELVASPAGQGYGRFVLGHLAYAAGAWGTARRYLESFVARTLDRPSAMSVALEGEVRMARATLRKIGAGAG